MNIRHALAEESDSNGESPKSYKNILVPVDLSQCGDVNLDTAIAFAEHYDADLWVLGFSAEPGIASDTRGLCHHVWDRWNRRAQVRLWDWVLQAREHHYRTFPLFVGGNYRAEEIVRTAKSLMADLIVVPVHETKRHLGGLKEAQADELLRKSATPVFVAISPKLHQIK